LLLYFLNTFVKWSPILVELFEIYDGWVGRFAIYVRLESTIL